MLQRLNIAWELCWKLLKDYLDHSGLRPSGIVTPSAIIRAAFANDMVSDPDVLIQILETRNALAHTYDGSLVEIPVEDISQSVYPALKTVHHTMLRLRDANN